MLCLLRRLSACVQLKVCLVMPTEYMSKVIRIAVRAHWSSPYTALPLELARTCYCTYVLYKVYALLINLYRRYQGTRAR